VTFEVLGAQRNRIEVEHADLSEETLVINKHQPHEHADLSEETLVINKNQPEWANSDFVHNINIQVPVSKETVPRLCRHRCIFVSLKLENIATYFQKAQVSRVSSTTQGIFSNGNRKQCWRWPSNPPISAEQHMI
jgi:hypothetical protein